MKEEKLMKEKVGQKKSNSKTLEIAVIIIAFSLIIIACLGAYFLLGSGSGEADFQEYLNIADQLVQSQDYKGAISQYWRAIEVDKYNEKPYISLGKVYETLNDYDNAMSIYKWGFEKTGSTTLQELAKGMKSLIEEGAKEDTKPLVDVKPTVNNFALGKLSLYTYEQYCNTYGTPTINMTDTSSCTVSFKNLKAVLYFYNSSSDQNVINTSSGAPFVSKVPNEMSLTDLSVLFGVSADITYDDIAALSVTDLKKYDDKELKKTIIEFKVSGFRVMLECDDSGTVANGGWNRLYPLVSSGEGNTGMQRCNVNGQIIDATTNIGVANAAVQICRTDDMQVVAEIVTDESGNYSIQNIEEGTYTAKVKADGFVEEDFEVIAYNWNGEEQLTFKLSPALEANTIRLVLEWYGEPRDLDSYLSGTSSSGSSVWVCFRSPNQTEGDKTIAVLDVDCTQGYGPETTTVYDTNGTYEFLVHDFNVTGRLGIMGATVKIYTADNPEPIIVEAPEDVLNTWLVCTITNGKIEVVNKAADDRPTTSVSGK